MCVYTYSIETVSSPIRSFEDNLPDSCPDTWKSSPAGPWHTSSRQPPEQTNSINFVVL